MDRTLLRYIAGAHSKTQNEFLYLETGVLNIERIISNRRMMYFQTILKRSDDEITKKIYNCQKKNPVKRDWIELINKDFSDIGMEINEERIKNETKMEFNARIRKHLKTNMLVEIKEKTKRSHKNP